jgi:hypothetical protein
MRSKSGEGRGRSRQSYDGAGKGKWGYTDSTKDFGAQDFMTGTKFRAEQQDQKRQTRTRRAGQDHAPADIADSVCAATERGNPKDY